MLALLIALVISAMNAGPPRHLHHKVGRRSGRRGVAQRGDRVVERKSGQAPQQWGLAPRQRWPSCEITECGSGARRYATTRAATRNRRRLDRPVVSADPSRRDTTRIAGICSPPGNDFIVLPPLLIRADGGSCRGALSAPVFDPMSAMNRPAPAAINSAMPTSAGV